MLREHLNSLLPGDRWVDVLLQTAEKLLKCLIVLSISLYQAIDSFALPLSNFGNIVGPLLPIATVTNLLHHTGKNDMLQLFKLHSKLLADVIISSIRNARVCYNVLPIFP